MSSGDNVTTSEESSFTFEQFISLHKNQLVSSSVPELYWQTLFIKLKQEVFDAGLAFQILCVESEQEDDDDEEDKDDEEADDDEEAEHSWKVVVTADGGIKCQDQNHIYLIDHAWTCRIHEARSYLEGLPQLVDRMAAMMEIEVQDRQQKDVMDDILKQMWKFNQTYSIGNFELGTDGRLPVWYVMDEFGSRIQHSDTPTFKTAPFMYAPSQMAYTIMWPVQDLEPGDEVTRDYVSNITDPDRRKALLLPWIPCDLKHISYQQSDPGPKYFGEYRMVEKEIDKFSKELPPLPRDRKLRVYMNYPKFAELTDGRFEVIEELDNADIIFVQGHFKDFRSLANEKLGVLVNQFPDEQVITIKDLLVTVCRRGGDKSIDPFTLKQTPKWLPVSYNLQTELTQFISYFQHRDEKGLENVWIIKPWNLTRSLDITITDNLSHILRLPDTGPKLACKYITDIVTIYHEAIPAHAKFDLRFVVMLSSVKPLKLYVHKKFYCRCSGKNYSPDSFDDMEKHFTCPGSFDWFQGEYKYFHEEFISAFVKQYPDYSWESVEESVHQIFLEVFEAATSREPPEGFSHFPSSRAVYGVDVLFGWEINEKGEKVMQPYLCEVNFSPDLSVYEKKYPQLTNDIFSTLFLDDTEGRPVKLLSTS